MIDIEIITDFDLKLVYKKRNKKCVFTTFQTTDILTTKSNSRLNNDMNRNNSRLHRVKLCPRIIQDILKFANEKELERLKRINSNVVTRMIEAEQRRRDPENPSTSEQQSSEKASERKDDSEQHGSQKPNKNLGLNAREDVI